VKLILDGEEERGSSNLPLFVDRYRERLQADGVVSFDGGLDITGVPSVNLGCSGMLYVELECRGARKELHSASARLFLNPAWRLTWALASIKDADERVLIDGFYDDIVPPSEREREMIRAMPWSDERQLEDAGLPEFLTGVRGPAAGGLSAGFSGEGPKSVIPSSATAKLEFRIVRNQRPDRVLEQLRAHLDRHGFADVTIRTLAEVEVSQTDPDSELGKLVIAGARSLYGEPLVKPSTEKAGRQGSWLGTRLNMPGISTGMGPPGWRGHSTDEFCTDEHLIKGIKWAAMIFDGFAVL
jgi:acetylornithine deacetylase/succinyl-diaminopimelate desuccinylase-like protein